MYQRPVRGGNLGAQYRNVDISSKVEGASPHQLIAILYEELITALATVKMAIRRGAASQQNEAHSRAIAILHALEHSLDFDKGGEIASALASVYGEAIRLVGAGVAARDVTRIEQAQRLIAEISEAWNQIA